MVGDIKKDYILEEIRSVEGSMKEIVTKVSDLDKTLAEYRISFDHHVAVDEQMYHELKRMNDILSDNTQSLHAHMRRTELLEQATFKLDGRLSELEIKKIQTEAVKKWLGSTAILSAKIIAGVAALVGSLSMLPELIQWLIR